MKQKQPALTYLDSIEKQDVNWKIRAKIRAPQYQIELIKRIRLLNLFREQADKPLVLITAPAGFGKTCLAYQWLQYADPHVFRTWVSLDADDKDPGQFLFYLLLALREAGVELGRLDPAIGQGIVEAPQGLIITELAEVLANQDQGMIFLDDYHLAETNELNMVISLLIQALPEQWQLVIAARAKPGMSISSMRLHGLVTELDDTDLVFDRDEADLFFNGCEKWTIDKLMSSTGGWPAALQLAKLCSQGAEIPDFSTVSPNNEIVSDYLSEQILAELSAEEHQFLIEVAIFDEIPVLLADHVRARNDSRYILGKLMRLRPLVTRQNVAPPVYQCQPLFRRFLCQQLEEKRSRDIIRQLRMRAATWYRTNGDLLSAVRHLCAIEEYDEAERYVMEAGGWAAMSSLGEGTMRNLLKSFPENRLRESVPLRLCRIPLLIKEGCIVEASDEMENMKTLPLPSNTLDDNSLFALELVLDGYQDKEWTSADLAHLVRATKASAVQSHELLIVLLTHEVIHHLHIGDIVAATACAKKALQKIPEDEMPYARTYFYFYLGICAWYGMRWKEAEQYYMRGVKLAKLHFGELNGVSAAGNAMLSHHYFYSGRKDHCKQVLHPALELISTRDGWHEPYYFGYDSAVRLQYEETGMENALRLLEQGMDVACRRGLQRIKIFFSLLRTELLVKEGDPLGALEFLTRTVDPVLPKTWQDSPFWWQLNRHYDRIRLQCLWYMGRGNAFSRQLARWENKNNIPIFEQEAEVWRACHEFRRGHSQEACTRLTPVLRWVEGNSAHDWLAAGGAPLSSILQYIGDKDSNLRNAAKHALSTLDRLTIPDTGRTSLLSEREYQALLLLQEGLSNKEIARHVDTSENAIKFHLKNLYRKLGVGKRLAAVQAAQHMGLIKPLNTAK